MIPLSEETPLKIAELVRFSCHKSSRTEICFFIWCVVKSCRSTLTQIYTNTHQQCCHRISEVWKQSVADLFEQPNSNIWCIKFHRGRLWLSELLMRPRRRSLWHSNLCHKTNEAMPIKFTITLAIPHFAPMELAEFSDTALCTLRKLCADLLSEQNRNAAKTISIFNPFRSTAPWEDYKGSCCTSFDYSRKLGDGFCAEVVLHYMCS